MTPNCNYVLDNNTACRCPALRGNHLCRHHTPEALARRNAAASGKPAPAAANQSPENNPWATRAYWRKLHRWIASVDELEDLDDSMDMILNALGDRQISARSGGSLLAALVLRKAELQLDAKDEHLRTLLDQAAALQRPQRRSV
jgi:hypothetical protein